MNFISILIALVLGAAVVANLVIIIKKKKSGKGTCGCNCSDCSKNCKKF